MTVIRKPFELKVQPNIKVLIYGDPGTGKTTLGLSSPAPLLLDFDGGVHRVHPTHQVNTVQVASWEDVIGLLKEDLSDYKTLVHDTAGKMLDYMSAFIIKNDPKMAMRDGSLQLKGYGARKTMFQNYLRQVSLMGKNLTFIAHDKEEKDNDTKYIRPEIGGSSGGDLIKEIDLVGFMEMVGKKRTISFDPCEKFYGKNTCGLEPLIELPDVVAGGKPNTLLTDIFIRYQNSLEDRKKLGGEYNALLEMIRSAVEEVTDPDKLNDCVDWAKKLQHIWDSKLVAGNLIKEKAIVLGCVMNAEKKYVTKTVAPAV